MNGGRRFPPEELAVVYAWLTTRPATVALVRACNADISRVRDFLQHAPARAIAVEREKLTAKEFDAARPGALALLRERCGLCGRCAAHSIKPP